MHTMLIGDKDFKQFRDKVIALKLPSYRGLTKLSRELNENGSAKIVDGMIVSTAPYAIVKCADLNTTQEQSVSDALASCGTQTDADVVSKRDRDFHILRRERDSLLVDSDHNVAPDRWRSMDAATQDKWAAYRQELRDLPANTADPADPTWPEKP